MQNLVKFHQFILKTLSGQKSRAITVLHSFSELICYVSKPRSCQYQCTYKILSNSIDPFLRY